MRPHLTHLLRTRWQNSDLRESRKINIFFQCQLTYHKLSQSLHIFMCIALAVEELDRWWWWPRMRWPGRDSPENIVDIVLTKIQVIRFTRYNTGYKVQKVQCYQSNLFTAMILQLNANNCAFISFFILSFQPFALSNTDRKESRSRDNGMSSQGGDVIVKHL